ncbi:MAG TPA: sporulation membrane protein YtrI [Bacillales bacterium]|nr:sporulation membrane protein YtrI [Bacillales bacterium]
MRIPQSYQTPGWQRFLAGLILGMILGWVFFIIISGIAQERQLTKIQQQKDKIEQLQKALKNWQEDSEEKNKELEQKLTVQNIKVKLSAKGNLNLTKLELSELKGEVTNLLSSTLVNQNIEYAAASQKLIFHTIENKIYTIDKNNYRINVQMLVIYSTVQVSGTVEKIK